MVMKKGQRFVASSTKVGEIPLSPGDRNDIFGSYPIPVFKTDISAQIDFVSSEQSELRGFEGYNGWLNDNSWAVFPEAKVSGFIFGISVSGGIFYPEKEIPTTQRRHTGETLLNWRFISAGHGNYLWAAKERGYAPVSPSISLNISHLWHTTEVLNVPSNVPSEFSSGYILIRGVNTAVVEYAREGGKDDKELFIMKKLNKPILREYIITGDNAFEFSHPATRMCFDTGLQHRCALWRINGGNWQKGPNE